MILKWMKLLLDGGIDLSTIKKKLIYLAEHLSAFWSICDTIGAAQLSAVRTQTEPEQIKALKRVTRSLFVRQNPKRNIHSSCR